MKKIVILCAGNLGREVAWLIEDINKVKPTYDILGYLDDTKQKDEQIFKDYKCLGPISYLTELNKNHHICAVIATQYVDVRKKFVDMFPDFDSWETLIHPSVNISDTSALGKGCIVLVNGVISVATKIGDHALLDSSVTVGHDCEIGDYVSIMPSSVVCGNVHIKDCAYLGTNSTVLPGMKIGDHATVGAGSVVVRNVKDNDTVMGVPAKVWRF